MKSELLLVLIEFVNRAFVVAFGVFIAMLSTAYVLSPFFDAIARISICR